VIVSENDPHRRGSLFDLGDARTVAPQHVDAGARRGRYYPADITDFSIGDPQRRASAPEPSSGADALEGERGSG
jgi:hypothetical protein